MADGVKIEIVSPERLLLSEQASSVTIPGSEGYLTVMGEHAPVMTTLRPGFVTVTSGGQSTVYFVRSGFADVSPAGVTILAEAASSFAEFDRPAIEMALAEAEAAFAAAATPDDKNLAQEIVDGLKNLLIEAAHMGSTHIH